MTFQPRFVRPSSGVEVPLLDNGQFVVPVQEVSKSRTPEVARTLEKAVHAGQLTLLQRTEGPRVLKRNRYAATRGWQGRVVLMSFRMHLHCRVGKGATVHGIPTASTTPARSRLGQILQKNTQHGDLLTDEEGLGNGYLSAETFRILFQHLHSR